MGGAVNTPFRGPKGERVPRPPPMPAAPLKTVEAGPVERAVEAIFVGFAGLIFVALALFALYRLAGVL